MQILLDLRALIKGSRTLFVSKPCIIHQSETFCVVRALVRVEPIVDWGLKLWHMWTGKPILKRFLHSAVLAVLVVKPEAKWRLFGNIESHIWNNRLLRLIESVSISVKASPWAESTTEVCLGNSILD